ncbi:c-type cytochrome [Microbulbifer sp. 2201CG32-9]|uniref:c-type cytochrome n=1 Tax=Microbulbifer sp. 2201CG32-9 TaxID=3232309 RepID=UPI00345BABFA
MQQLVTVMKSGVFVLLSLLGGAILLSACSAKEEPCGESAGIPDTPGAQRLTPEAVETLYLRSCYGCHNSGVGGAPRSGDTAAWAPRMAKGLDTLVEHSVKGYRAMPPRGLCFDCSEEEYAALIQRMAGGKSSQ